MRISSKGFIVVICFLSCVPCLLAQDASREKTLDSIYKDESHCLTEADIRADSDYSISCWCRDSIVDARYVYFQYLLPGKDPNLNGTFLALTSHIRESCGKGYDGLKIAMNPDWKWNGPEVVRIYPPDEVIKRIAPEKKVVEKSEDGSPSRFNWSIVILPVASRERKTTPAKTWSQSECGAGEERNGWRLMMRS